MSEYSNSDSNSLENSRIDRTDTPAFLINNSDAKNYEIQSPKDLSLTNNNQSKLKRQDSQFIHQMLEQHPSHSNLSPTQTGRKSLTRKITLPRRKSITVKNPPNNFLSTDYNHPEGNSTPITSKSPLVFSKNIFNFSTKLPKIVKKRSQNFYYNFYKSRSGKLSMPIIEKTPGMLDKAQKNKYIVKNRLDSNHQRYVDYNAFSYKYRKKNPLHDEVRLTTALYSKLKRKSQNVNGDLKIEDIDEPKIHIDDRTEIEYLKDIIPVADGFESVDAEEKDLEGLKAVESFYKHYKILEKVEQMNKVGRNKESVYTKMLKSTSQKRLLPIKMGVIGLGKSESCLDLRHFSLGNDYSEIACKTTKDLQFEKINLQDNRLEGEKAAKLLKSIQKSVYKINLAENKLGNSVLALKGHIEDVKSNLQHLNLKKCSLSDSSVSALFSYIKSSLNLKSINLSENNLSDFITPAVTDCFSKNQSIKEIYLRWNGLTSKFAGPFLRSIVESKEMMVIDLGYNHIGKGLKVIKDKKVQRRRRGRIQDLDVSEIIKEFLEDNKSVVHFDLSCNSFRYEECVQIAEGLKVNHTVYGFHFDGNYGYVDSEGFLLVEDVKDLSTMHGRKGIFGLEKVRHYNKLAHQVESVDTRNCCWICDGWMEMTFEYTAPHDEHLPIFILFKHEDFQPIYLSKEEGDEHPKVTLMVPDARLFFFFLVGFEIKILEENPKIFLAETDYVKFELLGEEYEYHVDLVNFMDVTGNVPPVFNEDYYPNVVSLPRSLRKQYFPEDKNKRVWNFHNSIFRHFKQDTKYLLERCFEADWSNGRYRSFIKDSPTRKKVKEFLKLHYKQLKDFYKHYSSFSNSKNFGIGPNLMIEIFTKMGALDTKYLNIAALGIEMTKVNYNSKEEMLEETNNPRNLICRYEFMELLVRCAHNKYMLSKKEDDYYSALVRFFDEYVLKAIQGYDSQEFRDQGYWSEEVDHLYECYKPVLNYIYRK